MGTGRTPTGQEYNTATGQLCGGGPNVYVMAKGAEEQMDPKNDNGPNDFHPITNHNGESPTEYVIQLSAVQLSAVYVFGLIVALLLILNISFLCYYNCRSTTKTKRYSKVSQFASSDDDMQNLKV